MNVSNTSAGASFITSQSRCAGIHQHIFYFPPIRCLSLKATCEEHRSDSQGWIHVIPLLSKEPWAWASILSWVVAKEVWLLHYIYRGKNLSVKFFANGSNTLFTVAKAKYMHQAGWEPADWLHFSCRAQTGFSSRSSSSVVFNSPLLRLSNLTTGWSTAPEGAQSILLQMAEPSVFTYGKGLVCYCFK